MIRDESHSCFLLVLGVSLAPPRPMDPFQSLQALRRALLLPLARRHRLLPQPPCPPYYPAHPLRPPTLFRRSLRVGPLRLRPPHGRDCHRQGFHDHRALALQQQQPPPRLL
eukprot:1194586-Prorocentrum_minimum.AAC.6